MTIEENVLRVRERIAESCLKAGRPTEEVTLIGVTKYVDTDRIAEALRAGITEVGENHAQEVREKLSFFKQHGCRAHFIGQLQTNKIKYVCGKADLIQSVDRLPLAEALEKYAAREQLVQEILLQVNIGSEGQKGGVDRDGLFSLLDAVVPMEHLKVRGLMCVPPALDEEAVRPYFASMRELLLRARQAYPGEDLRILSMGMTHDYPAAIQEGATMVRVGTGIFGPRQH